MHSGLARLPCCLSKGPLKQDFLDIYLTTFSESVVSKRQNLWGSYFASKYLKFKLSFKNAGKIEQKFFCFWDNSIWIGIVKLSLLRTGYFSLSANVLKSSPKIWNVYKRQPNCPGSDQLICQSCCDADFNSASVLLPCSLSKGPLKRDVLEIYLTTFSESIISKCSKFHLYIKSSGKAWEKRFCF